MAAAPVLLLRRLWYGYTFRRVKLVNYHKCAIVDPNDYYELDKYIWYGVVCKNGRFSHVIYFAPKNANTAPICMHRKLTNPPSDLIVDHINNNPLDNRRSNLRAITKTQNSYNMSPKKNCSSKYKGVYKISGKQRPWRAHISYKRKRISLGTFENEIDAAKAYDEAAKKYYREYAYLNFPDIKEPGLKGFINRRFR
jgi:hypothetical protein